VLVWTDDHDLAQQYKSQIVKQLHYQELEISYRRFYPSDMERLIDFLQKSNVGLLIVGVSDSHLSGATIQGLLEQLEMPILIIR
jgi:hypothetical protein